MSKSKSKEENSEKLINFYTLDDVKKFSPKIQDDQLKFTGIPLCQHILFCGGTGSGKSNAIVNYIHLSGKGKTSAFDKILMLVKKVEPLTMYLKDKLKDDVEIYNDIKLFPKCNDFKDLSNKNKKCYLLIIDDFVNDTNDKTTAKIILDYFTFGRNKGITCCFLSQSYYGTLKFIRLQVSWVILCGIRDNNDLRAILSTYNIGDVDFKTLKRMYDYAKAKEDDTDMSFLKICTYETPMDKKFSRNFLTYISPENFIT